jgi:hypothetical protein
MAFEHLISPARECLMVVLRSVQAVEGFHGEGVAEEFLVAGEASVVGSNCMGTSMEPLGIGRILAGRYITVSLHSCPGADPLSPPILLKTRSTFSREVNDMPGKDGTGPFWRTGSGTGKGSGMGRSRKGRMGGPSVAAGPGGECTCPQCGTVAPHSAGVPCSQQNCPKCGATMVRK